jgi:hypothetical protein
LAAINGNGVDMRDKVNQRIRDNKAISTDEIGLEMSTVIEGSGARTS